MSRYSNYFQEEIRVQHMLSSHGFSQWPSEDEQVEYLMRLEDKIDALAASLNLDIQTDIRGRLSVVPAEPVLEPTCTYWNVM